MYDEIKRQKKEICKPRDFSTVISYHVIKIRIKEGKDKVVPVHAFREYRGSRGIAPLILNLSARWR
jgi:hypothetical protein